MDLVVLYIMIHSDGGLRGLTVSQSLRMAKWDPGKNG